MKLSGSHLFAADSDQIRALLLDPRSLRWIVPGCQWLTADGAGAYQLAVRRRVGQTIGLYEGDLMLTQQTGSGALAVEFKLGGSLGRVSGAFTIGMQPAGPRQTMLSYGGDVAFAGGLTIHPPRLLQTATRAFVREAIAGLEQQIARASGARFVAAGTDAPSFERNAAAGRRRTTSILVGLLASFIALAWMTHPRPPKSSEQGPLG